MASSHGGSQENLKVVIIGKTGSGKSYLGNLIIGEQAFGTQSGMEKKNKGFQTKSIFDPNIGLCTEVVHTFDVECISGNDADTIKQWEACTKQDPYLILYTIKCDDEYDVRMFETYTKIKELWGKGFCENLVVGFTSGGKNASGIQQNIARDYVKDVIADAAQRYLEIDANQPPKEQVKSLLKMKMQMKRLSTSGAATQLTSSRMDNPDTHHEKKLSVVIIGGKGTSKTKISSVIVGKPLPSDPQSARSTTIQLEQINITVVDTPDLPEQDRDAKREVSKWKELSGSEEPLILLAVLFDKKYSERDLKLYRKIKSIWGQEEFKRRFVVVFTCVDIIQRDKTPQAILKKLGDHFHDVLTDANQRYVFFNDKTAHFLKDIVPVMIRCMESLSSFGAAATSSCNALVNAMFTTSTHDHAGHSAMDEVLQQSDSTTHSAQSGSSYAMTMSTAQYPRKDISILVIGKAGTGKSSLANAILQNPEFKVAVGMTIQTQTATKGSVSLGDMNVKVVDTPDITTLSNEISKQAEIRKWNDLTSPGPDVILLTIRCDSKYTPEDFEMYQELQKLGMSYKLRQNLLVVFTFGDKRQPDFEDDLRRASPNLHAVLNDASRRRLIYNDKDTSDKANFVRDLLCMVSGTIREY